MPLYTLVVTKGGHKLKEVAYEGRLRGGRGNGLIAEGITMEFFAAHLTREIGRPILDRTGLKGTYEFELEWSPDANDVAENLGGNERPATATVPDVTGPSIFTALQQQLGLKLESQKGPIEIIVINRVERPAAN
jgi:uncharacterized protein (TIGR03435 family)